MARTKQTARKSTGGKAPRKMLATKAARKAPIGRPIFKRAKRKRIMGMRRNINTSNQVNDEIPSEKVQMEKFKSLSKFIMKEFDFKPEDLATQCLTILKKKDKDTQKEVEEILKNKTALHLLVIKKYYDIVEYMIDQEIGDLNVKDRYDKTALHYAIDDFKMIKILMQGSPDINIQDKEGKTVLHHLTEQSKTKEIEHIFDVSADFKLLDKTTKARGSSVFHIACYNNNKSLIKLFIENGCTVDLQDKNGKTGLMYLCANNNFMGVKFLVKSFADVNLKTNDGQTALFFTQEADIDITKHLIQKGANLQEVDKNERTVLHHLMLKKDPIEKLTEFSFLDGFDSICDSKDKFGRTPLMNCSISGNIICSMFLIGKIENINVEDSDGNTAISLAVLAGHKDFAVSLLRAGGIVNKPLQNLRNTRITFLEAKENHIKENKERIEKIKKEKTEEQLEELVKKDPKVLEIPEFERLQKETIFRNVLKKDWLGLAYYFLGFNIEPLQAIRDSLNVRKFKLTLRLLKSFSDNIDINAIDEDGRNLVMLLFKNSIHHSQEADDLFILFRRKKANFNIVDSLERNILHYASMNGNYSLFEKCLLLKISGGVRDSKGNTALHYVLKDANRKGKIVKEKYFKDLITRGQGNPNLPDEKGKYLLLEYIKENDIEKLEWLFEVCNSSPNSIHVDVDIQDENGKSGLHYVVNPMELGTFENLEIIELLHSQGANFNLEDKDGKSGLFYASQYERKEMYNKIKELGGIDEEENSMQDEVDDEDEEMDKKKTIEEIKTELKIDIDNDFKAVKEKYYKEEDIKEEAPKVSEKCSMENSCVLQEGDSFYYTTTLNKTEIKYGSYGSNMFYIMQIIYNSAQDLYVLLNNWGRVGDPYNSKYQQTPFPNKEKCVEEFKKIFKSKTGNTWETYQNGEFSKLDKKYKVIEFNKKGKKGNELLEEFDYTKYEDSKLPKQLQQVMKEFCNVTILRKKVKTFGLDYTIGNLAEESIDQAFEILKKIKELLDALQKDTALKPDERRKRFEVIIDKSNDFYNLIPVGKYADSSVEPITNRNYGNMIKMLSELKDIEIISRILIAARNRPDLSPLDYVYYAVGSQIEPLEKESVEFKYICKYIKNTHPSHFRKLRIFKVDRKEERENYNPKGLGNKKLLFHGSSTFNYLSIMYHGLQIAPKEAPIAGHALGKGIYTSDSFEKSFGYTRNHQKGFVMLLETALGKIMKKFNFEFVEHSEGCGFDSVKGQAKNEPNPTKNVYTKDGVVIPLGKIEPTVNYNEENPQAGSWGYWNSIGRNEYVVYNTNQVKIKYLIFYDNSYIVENKMDI